jgi:hypothetical protein
VLATCIIHIDNSVLVGSESVCCTILYLSGIKSMHEERGMQPAVQKGACAVLQHSSDVACRWRCCQSRHAAYCRLQAKYPCTYLMRYIGSLGSIDQVEGGTSLS